MHSYLFGFEIILFSKKVDFVTLENPVTGLDSNLQRQQTCCLKLNRKVTKPEVPSVSDSSGNTEHNLL